MGNIGSCKIFYQDNKEYYTTFFRSIICSVSDTVWLLYQFQYFELVIVEGTDIIKNN